MLLTWQFVALYEEPAAHRSAILTNLYQDCLESLRASMVLIEASGFTVTPWDVYVHVSILQQLLSLEIHWNFVGFSPKELCLMSIGGLPDSHECAQSRL